MSESEPSHEGRRTRDAFARRPRRAPPLSVGAGCLRTSSIPTTIPRDGTAPCLLTKTHQPRGLQNRSARNPRPPGSGPDKAPMLLARSKASGSPPPTKMLDLQAISPAATTLAEWLAGSGQATRPELIPNWTPGRVCQMRPQERIALSTGDSEGERRDLNPRPPGPQPGALPPELRPPRDERSLAPPDHAFRMSTAPSSSPPDQLSAARSAASIPSPETSPPVFWP